MTGYPKWQGQLSGAPRIWAIIAQEARRAYRDEWVRAAFILGFGFAVISVVQLFGQSRFTHTKANFLDFIGWLRWPALGVAALTAGTVLDDDRRGAIELYLSRSVTRWGYLAGKTLAVVAMCFVVIFGPAVIYYGATFFLFENHPDAWGWVILGAAGYAAIWAIVVAGLGLGLSRLVRTPRASGILLFAGLTGIDLVLGKLLSGVTSKDTLKVLSPMSDMDQQGQWLFQTTAPFSFPWWWGAIALGGLLLVGWGIFWARRPGIKGVS